jgi:hypothetical protein
MREEDFFTKFANPHWRVEGERFFAPPPEGKVDFKNAHAAARYQTNNKQTSNKVSATISN